MSGARIIFDVGNIYYLPQFLPLWETLRQRAIDCEFVFYARMDDVSLESDIIEKIIVEWALPYHIVNDQAQAASYYRRKKPQWVVFGNMFSELDKLSAATRSAMLYHGIGIKNTYYDSRQMEMDVRFVEGDYRLHALKTLYPENTIISTGFAKLDSFFNTTLTLPQFDLRASGLDPSRKTILYAPTFYPSSVGCLPDNWPENFPDCNLIVKLHQFVYTRTKHRKQLRKINQWRQYANVYIAGLSDYSLIPYMAIADILVSEASSALFEFAALNKPIVWCDFLHLRIGHRGPLRYRLDRRMDSAIQAYADIGAHAKTPRDLAPIIHEELAMPEIYTQVRQRHTKTLLGITDGMASTRIADYLLKKP